MVIAIVHNEPKIAVRTPAARGWLDWGDWMKSRLTHERNTSSAFGLLSANSARIWLPSA